jgi:hypothetical protein
MELGSLWTDLHKILSMKDFRKSAAKIKVSLKSDKNNEYCTWRPVCILAIYRLVVLGMRNVPDKSCGKN